MLCVFFHRYSIIYHQRIQQRHYLILILRLRPIRIWVQYPPTILRTVARVMCVPPVGIKPQGSFPKLYESRHVLVFLSAAKALSFVIHNIISLNLDKKNNVLKVTLTANDLKIEKQ